MKTHLVNYYQRARVHFYKILSDKKVPNIILFQPLIVKGQGKICIGENVKVGFHNSPHFYSYSYFESRNKESQLFVGNNVHFNNNASVISHNYISIEDNCLFGYNLSISDSDGHPLNPTKRLSEKPAAQPIIIRKNVFVGNNVTITKGFEIVENTVIGTNSVVTKSFPENVIIGGNPAKIIKNLEF